MKENSLCLTTYVFGEKYHYYIPILLYSLLRAYPEYRPIIFVKEFLSNKLKNIIASIEKELGSVSIYEGVYNTYSIDNVQKGKSIRWVLDHKELMEYDYCYFIDIDMFYINEQPSLLSQHINHMQVLDLPYSNIIRSNRIKQFALGNIKQSIRNFGVLEGLKISCSRTHTTNKLSGLHFVKTEEYYKELNKVIENYRSMIFGNNSIRMHPGGFSNESMLYDMVRDSGMNLPPLLNTAGPHWLDYHRFNEVGFRPHHGIHLGIFRSTDIAPAYKHTLKLQFYQYYYYTYRQMRDDDMLLQYIIKNSPIYIRKHFERLDNFYLVEEN